MTLAALIFSLGFRPHMDSAVCMDTGKDGDC